MLCATSYCERLITESRADCDQASSGERGGHHGVMDRAKSTSRPARRDCRVHWCLDATVCAWRIVNEERVAVQQGARGLPTRTCWLGIDGSAPLREPSASSRVGRFLVYGYGGRRGSAADGVPRHVGRRLSGLRTRLFELWFDINAEPWYLGEPEPPVDSDAFRVGERLEHVDLLRFPVERDGRRVDVTISGGSDIIVVKQSVGALINRLAPGDVRRIPVHVTVAGADERYELLHVLTGIDAVDWERTPARARPQGSATSVGGTLASLGSLIDRNYLHRYVDLGEMTSTQAASRAPGSFASSTGHCFRSSPSRSSKRSKSTRSAASRFGGSEPRPEPLCVSSAAVRQAGPRAT